MTTGLRNSLRPILCGRSSHKGLGEVRVVLGYGGYPVWGTLVRKNGGWILKVLLQQNVGTHQSL